MTTCQTPTQTVPIFPINYDAIRTAIVTEITRVTGLQCVESEPEIQNAPRPKLPYFTLKILTPGAKTGDDSANRPASTVGGSTVVNIGGQRKMTVSFQSFGRTHEDSYNYMVLWQQALETETTQGNLRLAGIALWVNGNVADLSKLLNTGYEGRAGMDVEFGKSSNISDDQGGIEKVTIQGTVTSDQNKSSAIVVTGIIGEE